MYLHTLSPHTDHLHSNGHDLYDQLSSRRLPAEPIEYNIIDVYTLFQGERGTVCRYCHNNGRKQAQDSRA